MCSAVSVVRIPKIADVPDAQRTPVVVELLEIIQAQQEQMQALKDEITRLKGLKPRPQIRPSKLEDGSRRSGRKGKKTKRPGSVKRRKTHKLTIHETHVVSPDNLPDGSRFKG